MNSVDLDCVGVGPRGTAEDKPLLRALERFDCVVIEGGVAQEAVREWMEA